MVELNKGYPFRSLKILLNPCVWFSKLQTEKIDYWENLSI